MANEGAGVWLGTDFHRLDAIRERAGQVAAALRAHGIGAGDTISILARNAPAVIEVAMASAHLRATVVPLNCQWDAKEVHSILTQSKARLVFAQVDLLKAVRPGVPDGVTMIGMRVLPEIERAFTVPVPDTELPTGLEEYAAWYQPHGSVAPEQADAPVSNLYFTSGTTGAPKGVLRQPLIPEQAVQRQKMLEHCYGIQADSRSLITTPLYLLYAGMYALTTLRKQGTVVLLPRFDAEPMLQLIERHAITNLQVHPAMFVRLLQLPAAVRARYNVSSLRHVMHTGSPCPIDVKRAMIAIWGPVVWEMYGSTETTGVVFAAARNGWRAPEQLESLFSEAPCESMTARAM